MVEGPFKFVDAGGGRTAGLYLLRFDTDGSLLSPRTQQMALDELTGAGDITDVFVFSHGWNNDFGVAAGNYERFIDGFVDQGQSMGLAADTCKPLLIGVVWPSTSLLMPWEDGPQIAGAGDAPTTGQMQSLVTESMPKAARARIGELLEGAGGLTEDQAREAAQILIDLQAGQDPDDGSARPGVDDVIAAWAALDGQAAPEPADPDAFGIIPPTGAPGPGQAGAGHTGTPGEPQVAGLLGNLDPRNLLRMASLWKMKDRAGQVGAHGVSPLLIQILSQSNARVHLLGHSFGARVMLSGLCFKPLPRPVRSVLLLQPAVNRWCFAPDVVGKGVPGGYHDAPNRVQLPLLATMSSHDLPLHEVFQLAVRGSSLGEVQIAAVGDTFRYGALGGYGPEGLGPAGTVQPMKRPGDPYDLFGAARTIAIDGSGQIDGKPAIGGHSDVSKPVTWWALRCLVATP